jgi:UDP-N-acetylmuramoyl-tripeptide--D-alanyl-D-alanine ligase
MSISELYKLFISSTGISTDTRKIKYGNLYFALKGENYNGNYFLREALEKGAKYCVIDDVNQHEKDKLILVDDVLKSLQKLAKFHRKRLKTIIIGLTGSNGKTTTKELIKAVLQKKYLVSATHGNLNNHIGVPLTILNMKKETEIGIIEMGANHKGEIKSLCEMAMPNWGYITNFGKAHLEGFGSLKGVIKGKTEIYRYLYKKKGQILINSDDSEQIKEIKQDSVVSFGIKKNSRYVFRSIKKNDGKIYLKLNNKVFSSSLYGEYNSANLSAAITFGKIFNINDQDIQESLDSFKIDINRSQIINKNKTNIILDAYNSNPSSLKEALKAFWENYKSSKNNCIILGDMLELGKYSDIEHRKAIEKCLKTNSSFIFLVGDNFNKIHVKNSNIHKFKNVIELNSYLNSNKTSFDNVLVKGSRKIALEKVIDYL